MIQKGAKHSYLKSLIFSKLFLLFVVIAISFISITIIKGFMKRVRVDQDVERLKIDISALETANQDLESLLEYLESSDFAKQEGKEKFGLKEPGEQVVVLNNVATARSLPPTEEQVVELTNPQKWFRYFFGAH